MENQNDNIHTLGNSCKYPSNVQMDLKLEMFVSVTLMMDMLVSSYQETGKLLVILD